MQNFIDKINDLTAHSHAYTVLFFIMLGVFIKTVIHPPSRGAKNFFVSLLTAWTLGFVSYRILVNDFSVSPDSSTMICIFIGIISKEIFAWFFVLDFTKLFDWTVKFFAANAQKIADALIDRIIKK